MATSNTCHHCGFTNDAGATFCGRCGQRLLQTHQSPPPPAPTNLIYCPYCEFASPAGTTFCGNCGYRLTGGSARKARALPLILATTGLLFLVSVAAYFLLGSNWFGGGSDRKAAVVSEVAPSSVSVDPIDPTATNTTVAENEPTVTPFPTGTSRPTLTPLPTFTLPPPTATSLPPTLPPTSLPLPTSPPPPTSPPAPPTSPSLVCQQEPGPRWGPTMWDRYKERLGCALTGEIRTGAAYQYYQSGMMVWRQDANRIYVLYNNGAYSSFPDNSPDGYHDSDLVKGGFGYLWNTNADIRNRIGQPQVIEFNATNFAVQDFAGGTIFYFYENDARNYALLADNNTWKSAKE